MMVLCAVRLAPCPLQPLLLFTGLFSSPTPLLKIVLKIYIFCCCGLSLIVFHLSLTPGCALVSLTRWELVTGWTPWSWRFFPTLMTLSVKPLTMSVEIKIVDIKETIYLPSVHEQYWGISWGEILAGLLPHGHRKECEFLESSSTEASGGHWGFDPGPLRCKMPQGPFVP